MPEKHSGEGSFVDPLKLCFFLRVSRVKRRNEALVRLRDVFLEECSRLVAPPLRVLGRGFGEAAAPRLVPAKHSGVF